MRFTWLLLATASCAPPAVAATPAAAVSSAFWDHWGDGQAELASYRLTRQRYKQARKGTTVLVFVTETFTDAQRVKSDGGHPDEYPVLKVNRADDYQTGIYDYNVMTSTFVRIDGTAPIGQPVKVSMSMQEWCGHVYEQLITGSGALDWTSHSYFDGEADRRQDLPLPEDGLLLDALPILVRGLVGDLVPAGGSRTLPALRTLASRRTQHAPPKWTEVTIARSDELTDVTVPAGTFSVRTITTTVGNQTTEWSVEAAPPHRLIRWANGTREVAELLGVDRQPYWQKNREGDEALLERIGLSPPQ